MESIIILGCSTAFFFPLLIHCNVLPNETTVNGVVGILNPSEQSASVVVGTIPGRAVSHYANTVRDPRYSFYPNCPEACLETWIGDGWCDTSCAVEECGFDGEDCRDWCAPDCPSLWIKDNHCDLMCFRPECQYDGGDCAGLLKESEIRFPLSTHETFNYSNCPSNCTHDKLNNGLCDEECNKKECNFDGTDCFYQCSSECSNQWLGDEHCDIGCNNTACGFDKGDCKICSPGCEPGMVGNGICDAQCYSDNCYMDMGDCFGLCWFAEKIDYFTRPFYYPHCRNEWNGDGSCDCLCMTAECGYDYGDCKNFNCTKEWKHLQDSYERLNISTANIPHLRASMPLAHVNQGLSEPLKPVS